MLIVPVFPDFIVTPAPLTVALAPIVTVPVPFASISRLAVALLSVVDITTVPPDALLLSKTPVVLDAVESSIEKAGFVAPLAPTLNAAVAVLVIVSPFDADQLTRAVLAIVTPTEVPVAA
jgi:hypothetical protein